MKKKILQIIYSECPKEKGQIHHLFREEASAMAKNGIMVGVTPFREATQLMYRGVAVNDRNPYPKDSRLIQGEKENNDYLNLSRYYPPIADLSIDTFFTIELDGKLIELIKEKAWERAFIKKDSCALEHIEPGKSVWPDTSLEEMEKLYDDMNIEGKYAIRKYIDPEIIEKEERYWVLNGNIYHRHNIIPDVVKEAAKRLNKLGSRYYTIDATPEFVVEVNPGESSDRHAVNSAELFASWIKKEFA